LDAINDNNIFKNFKAKLNKLSNSYCLKQFANFAFITCSPLYLSWQFTFGRLVLN